MLQKRLPYVQKESSDRGKKDYNPNRTINVTVQNRNDENTKSIHEFINFLLTQTVNTKTVNTKTINTKSTAELRKRLTQNQTYYL